MSGPPYIVWSPEGPTPPKISYVNHKMAHAQAWQMARRYPGQQFYVMARNGHGAISPDAQGIEAATAGETERLDGNRESPVGNADAPEPTPELGATPTPAMGVA